MDTLETLCYFLKNGKTQFHVASLAKSYLNHHGFREITDRENLEDLPSGKYFLAPFSSIVIPFVKGDKITQIKIATAHTDFPMLKLKPNPEIQKNGYMQLNVETYGGLIRETWFDRPLGLAGKVVCKNADIFHPDVKLFDSEKPVCIIPNLAPHLKRGTKEGEMDVQKELIPIMDITDSSEMGDSQFLLHYVAEKLNLSGDDILDFDLYLYICEEPTEVGTKDTFLASPRIDNLSSVCATLEAIASAEPSDTLKIVALFDNEEIGSRSKQGADSILLADYVKRLTLHAPLSMTQDGFSLSVDVAHATHPNYSEKSDITNKVLPGNGVCLKSSASQRYVCDSEAGACILALCSKHHIAIQKTVNRSGMPGGQTLGPLLASYLPMRACDIGIPVLAMHSACELMHKDDYVSLVKLLTEYYA